MSGGLGLPKLLQVDCRILKPPALETFPYLNICCLTTICFNQLGLLVGKNSTHAVVLLNFFIG